MKRIALLLVSLFSVCVVHAQTMAQWQRDVRVYFNVTAPITYDGEKASATRDNVMVKNEVVRAIFCTTTSVLDANEIPFSFDRAGQLIPGAKLGYWSWGAFKVYNSSTKSYDIEGYRAMELDSSGQSLGVPLLTSTATTDTNERIIVPCSRITMTDAPTLIGKTLYIYLILMDTRSPVCVDGEWQDALGVPAVQESPSHVSAWSATLLAEVGYSFQTANLDFVTINYASESGGVQKTLGAMTPASSVASLTVDVEDETTGATTTTTVTGDDVEPYLTPNVTALAMEADGSGLALTADADMNLITYTLQTRGSLTEAEKSLNENASIENSDGWMDVDDWLADIKAYNGKLSDAEKATNEKVLANEKLPCYNLLRIGEGSSIPLPRVSGETTRFYRLKSE